MDNAGIPGGLRHVHVLVVVVLVLQVLLLCAVANEQQASIASGQGLAVRHRQLGKTMRKATDNADATSPARASAQPKHNRAAKQNAPSADMGSGAPPPPPAIMRLNCMGRAATGRSMAALARATDERACSRTKDLSQWSQRQRQSTPCVHEKSQCANQTYAKHVCDFLIWRDPRPAARCAVLCCAETRIRFGVCPVA